VKRILVEQAVLFISICKWCVLATVVGIIVGLATTVFLKALNYSTALSGSYSYFFLLLPVGLFVSSVIAQYLTPGAEGRGACHCQADEVIGAIHKRSGKINASAVPVKLVATIITISTGGSAGKEGPCAQIGGGISSLLADLFTFDDHDRKKLVICGISAGFASVFGTPVSGSIFGIEVLFVGGMLYEVLLPAFIAGIISYHVSSALGITYFYHPLSFVPVFSPFVLIEVILAGLFFGICSLLLIEIFNFVRRASERLQLWAPFKGIIGGVVLIGLTIVFSTQYLGLGLNTIEATLEGQNAVWYAFLLKILFTSITFGAGGTGGVVTPIFFIGASSGSLFAQVFGVDSATFSAIGYVSLLAGAANTPIAASIMAVELFGPAVAPYAALACVISYLMSGHRSIYPSQVLVTGKSRTIQVQIGTEAEKVKAEVQPRDKSVIGIVLKITEALKKKVLQVKDSWKSRRDSP
jgi:H+/Cl- antiporter ClcA